MVPSWPSAFTSVNDGSGFQIDGVSACATGGGGRRVRCRRWPHAKRALASRGKPGSKDLGSPAVGYAEQIAQRLGAAE
jgi:hypothetical protein